MRKDCRSFRLIIERCSSGPKVNSKLIKWQERKLKRGKEKKKKKEKKKSYYFNHYKEERDCLTASWKQRLDRHYSYCDY